jgi:V8-like Glu-specific endopeptidase
MRRAIRPVWSVAFSILVWGLPTACSQSPTGQETQTPKVVTQEDINHAVEDARQTLGMFKKRPKEEQRLILVNLSNALEADPSITSDLKNLVRYHPQQFLTMDPENLKGPDILKFEFAFQQVMAIALVPMAVLPNKLQLIDPDEAKNRLAKAVLAKSTDLLSKSHSVGRIETVTSQGTPQLVGTAFVVKNGYLMTACHVAEDIAVLDPATATWKLRTDTYVDFAATFQHSQSMEYVVQGVQKISTIRGFDVAVLQVAAKSRDKSANLPDGLDLDLQVETEQIPVALVGFPALDDPQGTQDTLAMMARLKAATPNVAKYVSPGQILSSEVHPPFHVLTHVASTQAGNSGSPLFSLSPIKVVGIHYCCTGLDAPDKGDCSSTADINIHTNEAISAADARALIPTQTADATQQQVPAFAAIQFRKPAPKVSDGTGPSNR